MAKIQNKFVIFGAIAAAALAVPGVLCPLGIQQASAQVDQDLLNQVQQNAQAGLAAVNANVNANVGVNVEDNEVAACVVAGECTIDQ